MALIGWVGAGAMGLPMLGHLIEAGHSVKALARRTEVADSLRALGAVPCETISQVVADADFVFTNVTQTDDVRAVLLGDGGVVDHARPGALCIDHSTISPVATREIAEQLRARGLDLLDAPVSGGVRGAQAGTLSIMTGGSAEAHARALPLLQCMGQRVVHMGPAGSGQVVKACNQIIQVVTIQGIAEAMLFARAQGVDVERMLEPLAAGFAGSKMLDLMGPKMATRDFAAGIEARLHAKDYQLINDLARSLDLPMPAVRLVSQQLQTLVEAGWGHDDTSSLLRVLESQQAGRF